MFVFKVFAAVQGVHEETGTPSALPQVRWQPGVRVWQKAAQDADKQHGVQEPAIAMEAEPGDNPVCTPRVLHALQMLFHIPAAC